METLILSSAQQSQLAGVDQQIPVCDQGGTLVGFFLTPALYKKLVAKNATVPFSDEELRQFRQSGGGSTLADFWKKMDAR